MTRIEIPGRFNGPPDSANGGYTCGRLAALLPEADAVEVTLRAPPPLDTALEVEHAGGGVRALHGDEVLAEGRPIDLELDVPDPIDADDAARASRAGYDRWSSRHPFPTCFVCGPERRPGDGMRIFPGPTGDGFAATWTPEDDRPELAWAALDCPTSAPAANFGWGPPVVLGRLAVRLDGAADVGAPHVVMSWGLGSEGRKREAGAALFAPGGRLVACARALWIELRSG